MKYLFDAGPLIGLKHYYSQVFKSLWSKFDNLVKNGSLISVSEVYNELIKSNDFISSWANKHKEIFHKPTAEEMILVTKILGKHKELIKKKNIVGGKPVADPFLIAKAKSENLILVTTEIYKTNAHSIPNICDELDVEYMNLQEFMLNENWEF